MNKETQFSESLARLVITILSSKTVVFKPNKSNLQ